MLWQRVGVSKMYEFMWQEENQKLANSYGTQEKQQLANSYSRQRNAKSS